MLIVVTLANCAKIKCKKFNDYTNRKGYKWNYFINLLLENYFVLFFTCCIGFENLEFGFFTSSLALNLSNIFTAAHISLCGIVFIITAALYIRIRKLKKRLA